MMILTTSGETEEAKMLYLSRLPNRPRIMIESEGKDTSGVASGFPQFSEEKHFVG